MGGYSPRSGERDHMSRSVSVDMQTHLDLSVTNLTTLWKVTRRDGDVFRFTEHDRDIRYPAPSGPLYLAAVGYRRTSVVNKAGLSVDNLEVSGFLDSSQLTEDDLRAGKFDGAEVELFMVNWDDLTMGDIKIRKGTFGEVIFSESAGSFTTELRGMMAKMNQIILAVYQFECRADLGGTDSGCRNDDVLGVDGRGVVIWPTKELRNVTYKLGDVAIEGIQTATDEWDVIFNYDTDLVDRGPANYGPTTQGGSVALGTGHFNDGLVGAPTNRFDTAYDLGYSRVAAQFSPGPLTIECWFNKANPGDTISEALLAWAGGNFATSSSNVWILGIVDDTDVAFLLFDGTVGGTHFILQGTMPEGAHDSSDHHLAVTRDASNVWRLFVDGEPVATLTNSAAFQAPALFEFRVGSREHFGSDYERFEGMIDDVRLLHGTAAYTTSFTPASEAHTTGPELTSGDLGNNIYHEITTAGLTSSTKPTFTTVVGNTTADGTAVWTARDAWTRHGDVDTVTDRQNFDINTVEPRSVDAWYQFGAIVWETGLNEGLVMEVKRYTDGAGNAGTIELFLPMPFDVVFGDLFRIYAGCDKLHATCRNKFDNMINFRAEPHIPGTDFVMKVPDGKGG